jgi:hypothetical protein
MAGLARIVASIFILETGWRKMMEVTTGACTHEVLSLEFAGEPAIAVAGA